LIVAFSPVIFSLSTNGGGHSASVKLYQSDCVLEAFKDMYRVFPDARNVRASQYSMIPLFDDGTVDGVVIAEPSKTFKLCASDTIIADAAVENV
jgi:hypothetical protein